MRQLPSPALIVAVVALFASLTGGAVAASLITGKNVKDGSLTGKDVKDRSLLAKDFKKGQVPKGAVGKAGPVGPAGVPGAKGDAGAAGPAGAVGPAGPTASAFVENQTAASFGIGIMKVLETTITTTVPSRLVAHASVDVQTNGTASNLFCFITDDPGTNVLNDWSIRANDDIPVNAFLLNTGLVGAKVLPAGSHTVMVFCGKNIGTVSFVEGDLSVIAVAT